MLSGRMSLAVLGALGAALAGCGHSSYEESRSPSNRVTPDASGLQGYDVISASDQMAADLLALPALNADVHQWTIVVGDMKDETTERGFGHNYNIFLARLKANIAKLSNGRVTLIENRDTFHNLRGKELDSPNERDDFGQTGGNAGLPAPAAAIQPDYVLHGVARDLPNRGSNYYNLEFSLSNLRNRTIPWVKDYEVTVRR